MTVFIVLHFVKRFLCDHLFLLNTVIIMTSFVQVQHGEFVISIITGKCAILIVLKLRFHCLCEIVQFLLSTVIIVTCFVWGHNCVSIIAIVIGECAILILGKLCFGVCHCCYCLLINDDSVILSCFILK